MYYCDNSRVYNTNSFNSILEVCVKNCDTALDFESYKFLCEKHDLFGDIAEDYFSIVVNLENMNSIGYKNPLYDLQGILCEDFVTLNVKSARLRIVNGKYIGISIHGHETKGVCAEDSDSYRLVLIIDDMLDVSYIMLISNTNKVGMSFRLPFSNSFVEHKRSNSYVYERINSNDLKDAIKMKNIIEKLWIKLKEQSRLILWDLL